MIQISHEQFEAILPLAVEGAEAKEKVILEHGIALSPQYMEDAKLVGVKYPDVARIKRPMRGSRVAGYAMRQNLGVRFRVSGKRITKS